MVNVYFPLQNGKTKIGVLRRVMDPFGSTNNNNNKTKEKLKKMKKGENMIKIMICPKNQGLENFE